MPSPAGAGWRGLQVRAGGGGRQVCAGGGKGVPGERCIMYGGGVRMRFFQNLIEARL